MARVTSASEASSTTSSETTVGVEWCRPAPDRNAPPPPAGAPHDLEMRRSAPKPLLAFEADLGVPLPRVDGSNRPHRLVAIGDSLTQGFQSFAIHKTDWSWPAQVARAMGFDTFTYPHFDGPPGCAGLPFNLEEIVRRIDETVGNQSAGFNSVDAGTAAIAAYERVREYWDRQGSDDLPANSGPYSNLGIWGWDLRDALDKSWGVCNHAIDQHLWIGAHIREAAKGVITGVAHANERTAIRTLWNSTLGPVEQRQVTQLSAAEAMGAENDGEGIDTLLVALGANNALGAVISMKVAWSEDSGYQDLKKKKDYTVWTPKHFKTELMEVAEHVKAVNAAHTIWMTVPHVTVVPLLRGVGKKPAYSRYFARYTRPWITDADFDAYDNPCITGDQARAIDSAIDEYNWAIKEMVYNARNEEHKDWLLVDLCGLLDRLAYKRYMSSQLSRPPWWHDMEEDYPVLPLELQRLPLVPDTRFYTSDRYGRSAGGLIALDGVHPTTIGYGLMAQAVLDVMTTKAQVAPADTAPDTGPGPGVIDFDQLIQHDSLILHPPLHMDEVGRAVGYLGERLDFAEVYLGFKPS